jgi:hypothetical protein
MALDFPASPTNGTTFTSPGGAVWTWDSAKWVGSGTGTNLYLPLTGGTISGSPGIVTVNSAATGFGAGFVANLSAASATDLAGLRIGTPTSSDCFIILAGNHTYGIGVKGVTAAGNFMIYDYTAPATRMQIDTNGSASFYSNNDYCLQVIRNQASGSACWLYLGNTAIRTWLVGVHPNGTFNIYDNTAGAYRFNIDFAGIGYFYNQVRAQAVNGGGFVQLIPAGTTTNSGYIAWFRGDGTTRMGYMGWDNTNINLWLENGASFVVGNGQTGFSGHVYDGTNNGHYCGFGGNSWASVSSYAFANASDIREKTDIESLPDDCLDLVNAITPQRYRWREGIDQERTHWGFIAQHVETAMQKAGHEFGGHTIDNDHHLLAYNELVAVLWKACQEMAARIEALEAR